MRKKTMQDIANELGITKTTVHRAFGNKDYISPELKTKILELADKYNYKPNRLAKSLSLKSNEVKLGIINKKVPEYFWSIVKKGIEDAENELADYGLKVIYTEIDGMQPVFEEYSRCMDILLKEKVDAIAMFPMDYQKLKDIVNEISEKGVRVATFNDDLDCSRVFYIGPKRRQIGRLAGELMGKFLKGKGNIIAFWDKNYYSVEFNERMQGFNDVLSEKYPDVHIIGYLNRMFDWFTSTGSFVLGSLSNVDGFYIADLDSCLPEIKNLVKMEQPNKIVCIGHELSAGVAEYIKDGTITASIRQDAYYQGYMAVKMLFDCVSEKRLPEKSSYDVVCDIVVAENIDRFVEQL